MIYDTLYFGLPSPAIFLSSYVYDSWYITFWLFFARNRQKPPKPIDSQRSWKNDHPGSSSLVEPLRRARHKWIMTIHETNRQKNQSRVGVLYAVPLWRQHQHTRPLRFWLRGIGSKAIRACCSIHAPNTCPPQKSASTLTTVSLEHLPPTEYSSNRRWSQEGAFLFRNLFWRDKEGAYLAHCTTTQNGFIEHTCSIGKSARVLTYSVHRTHSLNVKSEKIRLW